MTYDKDDTFIKMIVYGGGLNWPSPDFISFPLPSLGDTTHGKVYLGGHCMKVALIVGCSCIPHNITATLAQLNI